MKTKYMLIDFAVIDGPAMFEVLRPFQDVGYISGLTYLFEGIKGLDDRLSMKILDVSFDEAAKVGEALDKSGLDLEWMHYEEGPTQGESHFRGKFR